MGTTLAQQRAVFTLGELEKLKCEREDFKSFAAGLPSMILQNGFGQALAFLAAKAKKFNFTDKHYAAMKIILAWLVDRGLLTAGDEKDQLMQISKMEQIDYLRAQRESLAMLEWLKRYANADLFVEDKL